MTTQPSPQRTPADIFPIHAATRLGHVHYGTADLDKQIAFYRDVLGFQIHWRDGAAAGMGGGKEDLLRLTEERTGRRYRRTSGLYHTAFLLPTKWELAHLLRQIAVTRTPIQGMVNHRTHLAIYLPDAEGNGIELAWDFPKEEWVSYEEMLALGANLNLPLEPDELLAELERDPSAWSGLSAGASVGHVHLHVGDLEKAAAFYHDVLGFDTLFVNHDFGAGFFSAGGYHHHIGTNVWQGHGAPPPPTDALGLRYFSVLLPDEAALSPVLARAVGAGVATENTEQGTLIRDPFGNGIVLSIG